MASVYSCCFWFSLRLGGIIIGTCSIIQAVILLSFCFVGYVQPDKIKEKTTVWLNSINLLFMKNFVTSLQSDPEYYLGVIIGLTCCYIIICFFYVYGAYKEWGITSAFAIPMVSEMVTNDYSEMTRCDIGHLNHVKKRLRPRFQYNNILMMAYILVELIRLIIVSVFVTTLLLILKQNTMDIGLLIGASVVVGFILLGMFYLWFCAANLPIVINENKYDEQVATIVKLQQLLKENKANTVMGSDDNYFTDDSLDTHRNNIFLISKNKMKTINDMAFKIKASKIPIAQYQSSIYH